MIDAPPSAPYRSVGKIMWSNMVGDDARVLAAMQQEGGLHGCDAVVLPKVRGEWADCIVLEGGESPTPTCPPPAPP